MRDSGVFGHRRRRRCPLSPANTSTRASKWWRWTLPASRRLCRTARTSKRPTSVAMRRSSSPSVYCGRWMTVGGDVREASAMLWPLWSTGAGGTAVLAKRAARTARRNAAVEVGEHPSAWKESECSPPRSSLVPSPSPPLPPPPMSARDNASARLAATAAASSARCCSAAARLLSYVCTHISSEDSKKNSVEL